MYYILKCLEDFTLKRLLILLLTLGMILTMSGCSNKKNVDEGPKTTVVELYKGKYIDVLPEETRAEIYAKDLNPSDGEMALIGSDLSQFSFTSYNGETITLPEKGPYILEIVGSWCTYCQALTKDIITTKLSDEIPVYQYFMYGTNNDIDAFYETIEVSRPNEVIALVSNGEFEQFLEENEFYSVPLSIVFDENGKIALSHLGYMEASFYRDFVEYAKKAKLYDVKVNDSATLKEFVELQEKARDYIDGLSSIEIPLDVLNGTVETLPENDAVAPDADIVTPEAE